MTNILRYNTFLLALFSIFFYYAIHRLQLFGDYTHWFNYFTFLVLILLGVYHPRFSKGISELKTRKIKLIWVTAFLSAVIGFRFATHIVSDGIFYIIVLSTCIYFVINLSKVLKKNNASLT